MAEIKTDLAAALERQEMPKVVDDAQMAHWLAGAYENTRLGLSSWLEEQTENHKARWCEWNNQHADQRKHDTDAGPAMPFDGASDLRPFIVDEFINQDAALLTEAVMRGEVASVPVEAGDLSRARMVALLMKWLKNQKIRNLRREVKISANRYCEKGVVAVCVDWHRETQRRRAEVTLEELMRAAVEAEAEELREREPDGEIDMEALLEVTESRRRERLEELLPLRFPTATAAELRRMVRELLDEGVTYGPELVRVHDEPRVRSYSLDRDFFVPINVDDIQSAPAVFAVDLLNPAELRARSEDEGWKKGWAKEAIEQGAGKADLWSEHESSSAEEDLLEAGSERDFTHNLVRVVTAYARLTDHEGYLHVRRFVFCPDATEAGCAVNELFDYKPVRYPFVLLARECLDRAALTSRGYGEVGRGAQQEIKVQRDARSDRTQVATFPPILHTPGAAPTRLGPGVRTPMMPGTEWKWNPPPRYDGGSVEVEDTVMRNLRRYFGRANGPEEELHTTAWRNDMVSGWLTGWKEVLQHVWWVWAQFAPEMVTFRVTGAIQDRPVEFRREAGESYDFYISFDQLMLAPEKRFERVAQTAEILAAYDRNAKVDWGAFIEWFASGEDPYLAERLVRPDETAQRTEIEETLEDLTRIWAGADIDMAERVNPRLRLQVLDDYLRGSENIPATDVQDRYANDEAFRARIDKYRARLDFMLQQQDNAVTGRNGVPMGNLTPRPPQGVAG